MWRLSDTPISLTKWKKRSHGRRPWDKSIFAELASHPLYFNNTCSAKYVYERFVDCKSVLKDVQRYSRFYRIDFNRPGDANVEGILQEIQSGMNIINRGHSIKIQTSAFCFYLWVINNWWHWARVTDLIKSNDVQTTTTHRSGAISPVSVTSAPSVLPSQTSTHLPSQAPALLLPVTQTLASPHLPVQSSGITRPSIQLPAQPRRPSVQTFATSPPPNQASMPLHQPTREPAPPAALVPTSMPPPVPESLAELQGSQAHPASAPNASPASSFRVSRGASAARLARRDASESVYARSTTSSSHTGQTHTQSESSSAAGLSRIGGTPFVVPKTAGVRLVRQNQRQLAERGELAGQQSCLGPHTTDVGS
ncbi:hypothetical protein RhiLY_05969 [Ceratobasidium sp. AG-Ba]|nr:hypothetical protein RhiLY_05969 [Ceratobasidium sp. AG-Ba]